MPGTPRSWIGVRGPSQGLRCDIADTAIVGTGRCALLPDMDVMNCHSLAVPYDVMHHVVAIESSFNPYAIGVVGARLVRQPRNLGEAVATAHMLDDRGYNFSVGLAQVNRYNLTKYGLQSYQEAFDGCTNLRVGASILARCLGRSGHDWGRAFSCYYSGNFVTGFRMGYVQKVLALWRHSSGRNTGGDAAIAVMRASTRQQRIEVPAPVSNGDVAKRFAPAAAAGTTAQSVVPDGAVVLSARQQATPAALGDEAPPASLSQGPDTAFVF